MPMPQPSDIQDAFAAAVMNAGAPVPAALTSHTAEPPRKRFDVYRNNIYAGLIAVLEGKFPVVARLVGQEFFAATARVFIGLHPPCSPVLMEYGGAFADFLASFEPAQDLPYLPDVARLEWAWNAAYYTADAEPLEASQVRQIDPGEIVEMTVELLPSLSVVCSAWPVVTIWSANTADEEPAPIDAGSGGEDVMILRPAMDVEVRRLPPGGAAFVLALGQGRTFGEAAERAAKAENGFDLEANLAGLMSSGAIRAVHSNGR
jgi:hypothetical protein